MPNFGNEPMLASQDVQNLLVREQSVQERKDQHEDDIRRMRTSHPGGHARENSPNSREENMNIQY